MKTGRQEERSWVSVFLIFVLFLLFLLFYSAIECEGLALRGDLRVR